MYNGPFFCLPVCRQLLAAVFSEAALDTRRTKILHSQRLLCFLTNLSICDYFLPLIANKSRDWKWHLPFRRKKEKRVQKFQSLVCCQQKQGTDKPVTTFSHLRLWTVFGSCKTPLPRIFWSVISGYFCGGKKKLLPLFKLYVGFIQRVHAYNEILHKIGCTARRMITSLICHLYFSICF